VNERLESCVGDIDTRKMATEHSDNLDDWKNLLEKNLIPEPPSLDDVLEVLENDLDYVVATIAETLPEKAENESVSISDRNTNKKPCQVCGNPSNGITFFGAISCDPCRVFFRRACLSKRPFMCTNKTRKSCKQFNCRKCRLDKCLAAGMKPTLVSKRLLPTALNPFPEEFFTLDNEIEIKGLWSTICAWEGQFLFRHLPFFTDREEIAQHVTEVLSLSSKLLHQHNEEEAYVSFLMPFYAALPPFKKMSLKKAQDVIRNHLPLCAEMCLTYNIHELDFLYSFYFEFSHWLKKGHFVNEAKDVISSQITNFIKKGPPTQVSYEEVFLCVPNRKRPGHERLLRDVADSLLGNDKITWMLLVMIILTDGNFAMKNYYLKLFYGYVRKYKSYRNGNEWTIKMASLPKKLMELKLLRTSD